MRALLLAAAAALVLAVAATGAAPPGAPALTFFAGLDSRQSSVNPADVQIAVGPTAVVQAVNSSIAIFTTSGQLLRQQTLGQLFSGGGVDRSRDSTTDPRVLYDLVSQRFFAVMFDISRVELVVAMSASPDPLGAWAVFPLPSSGGCTDQPRLGTSDNAVVVTDDLFSACSGFGRFLGSEVLILNKQEMLGGVAAPRLSRIGPDRRFASVTPAAALVSSSVLYLVAVSETNRALQLFGITDPASTTLPFKEIALGSQLTEPDETPQRGTTQPLDVGDDRIQNAVFDGGRLYAAATVGCPTKSCARVVELDPAGARLVRETTVALPNGRALLYPAVAPDSRGNAVLGYTFSSAADFPGLGYTYVRPDGQIGTPVDVLQGTAAQTSGRFGDYSGAARDPSDPSKIWVSAEIGQSPAGSPFEWASGIAAVRVPPQAPAIVAATVSGGSLGAAIYAEGLPTTYGVELGPTRAYGSRRPGGSLPATAREQPVSVTPAGLLPGATYHARIVATNSAGTTTGPDVVLKTPPGPPRVAYPVRPSSSGGLVTLRARIATGGAATRVVFEYGATVRYGSRTRPMAPAGGDVSTRVRLQPGRLYHFRSVATNAKGKTAGPDRTVRT